MNERMCFCCGGENITRIGNVFIPGEWGVMFNRYPGQTSYSREVDGKIIQIVDVCEPVSIPIYDQKGENLMSWEDDKKNLKKRWKKVKNKGGILYWRGHPHMKFDRDVIAIFKFGAARTEFFTIDALERFINGDD